MPFVTKADDVIWTDLAEQLLNSALTTNKRFYVDRQPLLEAAGMMLHTIKNEQIAAAENRTKLKATNKKLAIFLLTLRKNYLDVYNVLLYDRNMSKPKPAALQSNTPLSDEHAMYSHKREEFEQVQLSQLMESIKSACDTNWDATQPSSPIADLFSDLAASADDTQKRIEKMEAEFEALKFEALRAKLFFITGEQSSKQWDGIKENLQSELHAMEKITESSSEYEYKKQQLVLLLAAALQCDDFEKAVIDRTTNKTTVQGMLSAWRRIVAENNIDRDSIKEKKYDLEHWVQPPSSATSNDDAAAVVTNWVALKDNAILAVKEYQTSVEGGFEGKFRAARLLEALEALTVTNSTSTLSYEETSQRRELVMLLSAVVIGPSTRLAIKLVEKTGLTQEKLKKLHPQHRIPPFINGTLNSYLLRAKKLIQSDLTNPDKKSSGEICDALIAAADHYLERQKKIQNPDSNAAGRNRVKNFKKALEKLKCFKENSETHEKLLLELIYLLVKHTDANNFKNEVLATFGLNKEHFNAYFTGGSDFLSIGRQDAEMIFDIPADTTSPLQPDWTKFKENLRAAAAEYLNTDSAAGDKVAQACARNLLYYLTDFDLQLLNQNITPEKAQQTCFILASAIVFGDHISNSLKWTILEKIGYNDDELKLLRRDHVIAFSNSHRMAIEKELKRRVVIKDVNVLKERVKDAATAYRKAGLGHWEGKLRAEILINKLNKLKNLDSLSAGDKDRCRLVKLINAVVFKSGSTLLKTAILDFIADIEPYGLTEENLKTLQDQIGAKDSDIADINSESQWISLSCQCNDTDFPPNNLLVYDIKPKLKNALNHYMNADIAGSEGKRRAQVAYQMLQDPNFPEQQLSSLINYLLTQGTHLRDRILIHTGMPQSALEKALNTNTEAKAPTQKASNIPAPFETLNDINQFVKNIFTAIDAYQINNMGGSNGKRRVAAVRYALEEIFFNNTGTQTEHGFKSWDNLTLEQKKLFSQIVCYFAINNNAPTLRNNILQTTGFDENKFEQLRQHFKNQDVKNQMTPPFSETSADASAPFLEAYIYSPPHPFDLEPLIEKIKIPLLNEKEYAFQKEGDFIALHNAILQVAKRYQHRPKSQRDTAVETRITQLIFALNEIYRNYETKQQDWGDSLVELIRVTHLFIQYAKTGIEDDIQASIELRFGDFLKIKAQVEMLYQTVTHIEQYDAGMIFKDSVSYSPDIPEWNDWAKLNDIKTYLESCSKIQDRQVHEQRIGLEGLILTKNFFSNIPSETESTTSRKQFILNLCAIVFNEYNDSELGQILLDKLGMSRDQLKKWQYEFKLSNNAARNKFFELKQKKPIKNWPELKNTAIKAAMAYLHSGLATSGLGKKMVLDLVYALTKIKIDQPVSFREKRKLIGLIQSAVHLQHSCGCPHLLNTLFDYTGLDNEALDDLTKSFGVNDNNVSRLDQNVFSFKQFYQMLIIAMENFRLTSPQANAVKSKTETFLQKLTEIKNTPQTHENKMLVGLRLLMLAKVAIKLGDKELSERLCKILPYTADDIDGLCAESCPDLTKNNRDAIKIEMIEVFEPGLTKNALNEKIAMVYPTIAAEVKSPRTTADLLSTEGDEQMSELPATQPTASPTVSRDAMFAAKKTVRGVPALPTKWATETQTALQNAIKCYLAEKGITPSTKVKTVDEGARRALILSKALEEITLPGVEGEKKLAQLICAVVLHTPHPYTLGSKNLSARILTHSNLHVMQLEILETHFKIKNVCALLAPRLIDARLLKNERRVNVVNPVQNWRDFKKEILEAIEAYLEAVSKTIAGFLKAENLQTLVNDINDPDTEEKQKRLVKIVCSFVLFAKSNTLKGKIFDKTTLNDNDFVYLQSQYGFSDTDCVEQAKQFDSRNLLQDLSIEMAERPSPT